MKKIYLTFLSAKDRGMLFRAKDRAMLWLGGQWPPLEFEKKKLVYI